jgi:L-rhamnose mutarotase
MSERVAFALKLPRDNVVEYQRRHAEIWPELEADIRAHGGSNFTIFAVPELDHLFGYLEVEDLELWRAGAATEINQRWWRYMADVMPTNPDSSPIGTTIFEVFHHA